MNPRALPLGWIVRLPHVPLAVSLRSAPRLRCVRCTHSTPLGMTRVFFKLIHYHPVRVSRYFPSDFDSVSRFARIAFS